MINFIDNFLSEKDHKSTLLRCMSSPFYYGETDEPHLPPVGMVSVISEDDSIRTFFDEEIKKTVKFVKDLQIYRMYINCFAPGEKPYYHVDGESGVTCLYSPNDNVNMEDGGETQFILENKSINVLPVPNRLSFFNSNILHRATSFRNKHRFTIAIKYS